MEPNKLEHFMDSPRGKVIAYVGAVAALLTIYLFFKSRKANADVSGAVGSTQGGGGTEANSSGLQSELDALNQAIHSLQNANVKHTSFTISGKYDNGSEFKSANTFGQSGGSQSGIGAALDNFGFNFSGGSSHNNAQTYASDSKFNDTSGYSATVTDASESEIQSLLTFLQLESGSYDQRSNAEHRRAADHAYLNATNVAAQVYGVDEFIKEENALNAARK